MKRVLIFALVAFVFASCSNQKGNATSDDEKKVGVLLVNHGSHSEIWRNMLLDIEDKVKDDVLAYDGVEGIKTAFMEYNEPSIATQLKWFDDNGYTDVILVPVFLTVSSHYSHDIPVIAGLTSDPKIKENLAKEKIEVYKATARVTITPPLDFTTLLKKNVARRVEALSKDPSNESILLVAYGDEQYNQQWEEMVSEIGKYLKVKTKHETVAYSWCGHIVHYSSDPTREGIEKLMEFTDNVIVIPVLVANDEHFQGEIIQNGVDAASNSSHVIYKQDAILPDGNLNQWVKDITKETLQAITE